MRALILRGPPPSAVESLPTCFGSPVDEGDLREWLAHPSAGHALTPVRPGARASEVLATLFGEQDEDETAESIAVLYVPSLTLVSREDATSLDLDAAFRRTLADADDSVEKLIEDAETAFEEDDWIEAERLFRLAEEHLSEETSARRAEVLAGLGEISRLQGRTDEASGILERALSMSPKHPAALRGRATLARTRREHAIAAALLYRLASVETEPGERGELLSAVAEESLQAARESIKAALELRPKDVSLLERLRAVHEAAGQWNDVVGVAVELAEAITDHKARARALASAAEVCATRAKNSARAVALYEAAIEDDPQVPGAFAAIEAALVAAGDPRGLAAAYERQVERLGGEGATTERLGLLERLAIVRRDQLRDSHAAIQVLDRIVTEDPANLRARIDLADLLEQDIGQRTLAVRCLEVAAQYDPLAATVYRRLLRSFARANDPDRAFSASAALVALGEASADEQAYYAEHAPQSPLGFEREYDDDIWTELLPDERAADVESVFAAIEEHCIEAWIASHEASGGLTPPPENRRVDPGTSTVAAARTFVWASRLLGVPTPAVYVVPENARVSAATLPTRKLSIVLGRPILTGRSPIELVFIAARHLAYCRPGRRVLAFYPTPADLEPLLRAAIAVLRPDLVPHASLHGISLDVGTRLDRALDPTRRAALADALGRIWTQGGVVDLDAWMRTVEATACRAALLATGDVAVARLLLAVSGGPAAGLSAADRMRDLLGFSVTQRYAALRRLLGVQIA